MRAFFGKLAVAFVAITLTGCAIMDKNNRVLLNKLDEAASNSFLTETKTARIVAAPLAIPIGIGAAVIDMAIITPSLQVVPTYRDTKEWVWVNPQGSEFRQAVLFLPKVALTPLVYAGTWTMRSFFFY